MIENPIYGGAYAYGKTAVGTGYGAAGVGVKIRRKPRADWLALMPNAHEGYVSWEKAETIRTMVSSNVPTSRHHGAPKHGDALLAGLIRCRRCGRKLTLRYSGAHHHIPRYPIPRLREMFGRHAFEPNSRERCILITINSTIFVTLWNVMDRRGFNCRGGGERQNGQAEPI